MRVRMLKDDGWARKGWSGTLVEIRPSRKFVVIAWENGKTLSHAIEDVIFLDKTNDPNIAFKLHKCDFGRVI